MEDPKVNKHSDENEPPPPDPEVITVVIRNNTNSELTGLLLTGNAVQWEDPLPPEIDPNQQDVEGTFEIPANDATVGIAYMIETQTGEWQMQFEIQVEEEQVVGVFVTNCPGGYQIIPQTTPYQVTVDINET